MKKAKGAGSLSPMVTLLEGANIKLDPREIGALLPGWFDSGPHLKPTLRGLHLEAQRRPHSRPPPRYLA
jgi:hypothetical protein